MASTYLTTSYKDRDQVKALGARWDPEEKRWYVPGGKDLGPFDRWLPTQSRLAAAGMMTVEAVASSELALADKGIPLSRLLAGVSQAVAQAYRTGVWTTVEVLKVDAGRGHVYMELAERDTSGESIAQARAVIWADTANQIVPAFQQATGVVLGGGIKLLVRAKPAMHALYGMSLVVDAIDPDYTLGDLEAKKRDIRARLQREGLFDGNRKLPAPWDYRAVLVVAPQGAAGLGDFQAEAERLQRLGICDFTYVFSRFQGEGAATEVLRALSEAMNDWHAGGQVLPEAVVIIRGGGAVNDLAWLNDYDLARFICELQIPLLTGIGHERDNTVLDEVANIRFDTPSKVIGGIEQVIVKRVHEVKASLAEITRITAHAVQSTRRAVEQADTTVRHQAQRQLAMARESSTEMMSSVRLGATQSLRDASQFSRELLLTVRHQAAQQIAVARQAVPAMLAGVRSEARQTLREARAESGGHLAAVFERAALDAAHARQAGARELADVQVNAHRWVADARTRSEALMREIAGQGPEKSLSRGFAIVRAGDTTITSVQQAIAGVAIEIQFRDGLVAARTNDQKGSGEP
jgi:exodeoxyribonuclease VII large subunit